MLIPHLDYVPTGLTGTGLWIKGRGVFTHHASQLSEENLNFHWKSSMLEMVW